MNSKKYLLTFGLVLSSIVSTYFVTVSTAQQGTKLMPPAIVNNDYQTGATLFMQKAAEYRALCYQAFYWGQRTLEDDAKLAKKLPKTQRKMPRAVVVDIDETMLDNSPAQAYGIRYGLPFTSKDWYAWGEMRKAKAIPGAVEFANYAKSQGVRVFYVSNRDDVQLQATLDNLKTVGFPDISAENVLLRSKDANGKYVSTKEPRRLAISEKYRVVILMGDNLNDLSTVYEQKSVADRFAAVEADKALYGTRFIVLPNAMYGEWESAIYRDDKTQKTNDVKRANALELP